MAKADFGNLLLRLLASCFHMVTRGAKRSRLNRVLRVSVWEEKHQNGMSHYHFPIQAEHPWYACTLQRALRAEGIFAELSADHDYYWTSFLYVAVPSALPGGKTQADLDPDPWLSPEHPSVLDMVGDIPRGARATDKARARRFLGSEGREVVGRGGLALSDKEFAAHAVALDLRTTTQLLAWVQTRAANRKALAGDERALLAGMEAYCFQHQADLARRLAFAWELQDAPRQQELQKHKAWDMLLKAGECICECGGVWIQRTEQLLRWHCEAYPAHAPPEERPVSEANVISTHPNPASHPSSLTLDKIPIIALPEPTSCPTHPLVICSCPSAHGVASQRCQSFFFVIHHPHLSRRRSVRRSRRHSRWGQ